MTEKSLFDVLKLKTLPPSPGVYLWKDQDNNVIYVGKANNIRLRTQQYFKGVRNSFKTAALVANIADIDYILTKTERQALILERNLIEKYDPKFNIKLTDDKHYPYLCLKLTKKLEISLVYKVKTQGDAATIYYGPFPTGYGGRRIVNLLNRIFTYQQGLPIKRASLEFWTHQFQIVKKLLGGQKKVLLKTLEHQMLEAAEKQHFEIAHDIKETIKAFQTFEVDTVVNLKNAHNIDVLGFVVQNNFIFLTMLFYRQGFLLTKINKIIEITSDVKDTIRQFVSQYYEINLKPDYVVTNLLFETVDLKVIIPRKGQNKQILNLALKNIELNFEHQLATHVHKSWVIKDALESLKQLLKLEKTDHIMIVDSSHTNNTLPVSVLLTYRNGIKNFREYRKYNLKAMDRHADVDYLKQALTKHFIEKMHSQPDLLIVDGGKAQLNEAYKLLPKFTIVGLVKDDHHQTKGLINQSGQFVNINNQSLFNFLNKMQIEVDRYARTFHQRKRFATLEGVLLTIPGIGKVTEQKLLNHFKSYANIYNASIAELQKVIPRHLAEAIKKRLGENDD